jgi:hypothetical protein
VPHQSKALPIFRPIKKPKQVGIIIWLLLTKYHKKPPKQSHNEEKDG